MGPSWRYPAIAKRRDGSLPFDIGVLILGLFLLLACALFIPEVSRGRTRGTANVSFLAILGPGIGGILTLAGAVRIIVGIQRRKTIELLAREGTPCWGRILESTLTGNRRPGSGHAFAEVKLTLEAFAAAKSHRPDRGAYRSAAGTRVADRVEATCFVPEPQLARAAKDEYCALLLHPNDPSKIHIDGFRVGEGMFLTVD